MTLRNLSDKEIKTINGGGYIFPITTAILTTIFGTAENLITLTKYAINTSLTLLMW